MISQTKAVIWIIVAVVVSSAIVSLSLNQDKVMSWIDKIQDGKDATEGRGKYQQTDVPNSSADEQKKEFSIKEIINNL